MVHTLCLLVFLVGSAPQQVPDSTRPRIVPDTVDTARFARPDSLRPTPSAPDTTSPRLVPDTVQAAPADTPPLARPLPTDTGRTSAPAPRRPDALGPTVQPAATPSLTEPPRQEAPSRPAPDTLTPPDAPPIVSDTTTIADSARVQTLPDAPPVSPDDTRTVDAIFQGIEREFDQIRRGFTQQLDQLRSTFTLTRLAVALLELLLTFIAVRLAAFLLERLALWRQAQASRIRKAIPIVRFVLWFLATWLIVNDLFGGSGMLLFLLAVLVLGAAGFALFQFLRDLLGGVVLLIEQPFQIGSRVTIGPHTGDVSKIGLRTFRLAAPDGSIITIPNADVLRGSVTSTSPDMPEGQVSVILTPPEAIPGNRAQEMAREAAYASPYIFPHRPVSVRWIEEEPSTVKRLVVSAYVFDGQYAKALQSDILRLTHAAFAREAPNGTG